ncbi:hypothetical protein CC78DRAFT_345611 [Lojkania enalia]|uniref:Uncharacterized protein n=1 Tax=Lojkania enalia TaxID=147567 RepID=A0A9P4N1L0_9PLEO|nr:hypothetical protein CC78DRAFT_345611 [Didymosphaeria enalia]
MKANGVTCMFNKRADYYPDARNRGSTVVTPFLTDSSATIAATHNPQLDALADIWGSIVPTNRVCPKANSSADLVAPTMVVNLKRKRAAVSYKEPSTDEEFSYDSDQESTSRKKYVAPQRRSARHQPSEQEQTSSQDPQRSASPVNARKTGRSNKTRLRGRPKVSYRESSTNIDSDEDFEVEEINSPREDPRPRVARVPRTQNIKRTRGRSKIKFSAPLKRRMVPQRSESLRQPIISDGIIPPWASLPYHVLLQIFVYASHPLHDENFAPTSSISWLAEMARMCSAFTKPALTALYRNPPIFAVRHKRTELVHHLLSPPSGAHGDYSVMVKRLELDWTRMSKLTDPTHSLSDLAALISTLTTLKEVDIFDPMDKPPYRERSKRIRSWTYPDDLFDALRNSSLRLRSWRWNGSLCLRGPLWMKNIHTSNAFQSLREVVLTKFHPTHNKIPDDKQPTSEELLGSALAALPNLKSLVFESCTIVNGYLLPLLPTSLVNLELTNCKEIVSEPLQAFLATHGSQLEVLTLNHNQSLDISFLVDLKGSCPQLEVLRMDLNYFNSFSTSDDNEPLYDELLKEGEIPSWPPCLRIIDLEYLRNWSPNAAIAFFSSLIDAAKDLPWLQEITILASVDIEWRKRAEFREKWTARFQNIFARKTIPPNPHLVSLRAFRAWKMSQNQSNEKNDSFLDSVSDEVDVRIESEDEEDSDIPLLPPRKHNEKWNAQRLRSRAIAKYEESLGDESGSEDGSNSEDIGFIQGRCHKVSFRIDNLRPREEMYDEGDFLDSEASGDEDWDGNDVVDDGYAW